MILRRAVVAAGTLLALSAAPAAGDIDLSGGITPEGVSSGIDSVNPSPTRGPASGPVGTWVATPIGVCGANGETAITLGLPQLPPTPAPPFPQAGTLFLVQLYSPDGRVLAAGQWNQCTEPPPAPPPTAEAVFAAAAMPHPPVTTSPPGHGLVGFANWFWYEGPDRHAIAVTLDGWHATTTATPTAYTWIVAGAPLATTTHTGSPDHPATRHVFINQGTYDLQLIVTWTATFTFTGYGTTFTAPLAGPVDIAGPVLAYPVEEREAVIIG